MVKEKGWSAGKKIFVFILIISAVLLILSGTRIYLVIHYLLGNDVLINTIPSSEDIFLVHGESQVITFRISVLANPFCKVECNYTFEDISYGKIEESGSINTTLTEAIIKEYKLFSPNESAGQKLYRFGTSCIAVKTALCDTEERLTKKYSLITLNYGYNPKENLIINETISSYPLFLETAKSLTEKIYGLNETIYRLENLSSNEYKTNWNQIESENKNLLEQIKILSELWNAEKISEINLEKINFTIEELKLKFSELNDSAVGEIENYNFLIQNIAEIEKRLKEYSNLNFTEATASELNKTILEFNSLKSYFLTKKNISERNSSFYEFEKNYSTAKSKIEWEIEKNIAKNFQTTIKLSEEILINISLGESKNTSPLNYFLKNLTTSCCLNGKCASCCDNSCEKNSSLYPIIFIHGHDLSASVSPEYNLENFAELKNKLEDDGYINAGSILINVPESSIKGIWGETRNPVSVGASYYFDSIKNESVFNALQLKKDNIDTYSIRLKNIIDSVKYKTNREKVILVSHSMGGLVVRRYIQLFEENDVDKIILIASPNKGIGTETLKICKLFGAKKECDDMHEDSVTMNKLGMQTGLKIPVYNIIGVGCDTYGKIGDGIITNQSAYLNWTQNYYINGTCKSKEFKYLHSEIVYPEEYPQTYEIIKNILKNRTA